MTSSASQQAPGEALPGEVLPGEVLRADALVKRYRGRAAVDGVDLRLMAGQVHGLLGANGAGKSTLLRMLLGLTQPDSGRLRVLGRAGGGGPGVAGFTGSPRFWPGLTARRILLLLADLEFGQGRDPGRSELVGRVLDTVGLTERAGDRVDGFSTGLRQRLALAAALLRSPRVLLLDEPATGLDPVGLRDLQQLLRDLAAAGTAILLSSHDLAAVSEVCEVVTVLEQGRTAWSGSLAGPSTNAPMMILRTSDDLQAQRIASDTVGVVLTIRRNRLTVTGQQADLDTLVLRLSAAGVVVRELAAARHPLEAAFGAYP